MGKLNIAHHKSYHPYRRDNIEKVKRDEEEARLNELKEEGRMTLADSEARMDLLRQRAGISDQKKKSKKDDDEMKLLAAAASGSTMTEAKLPTTNGHINLFEDLEQNSLAIAATSVKPAKKSGVSDEKGFALAPSEKDLKPWYSEKKKKRDEESTIDPDDERRMRDETRKSTLHDPLFSITKQLASRSSFSSSSGSRPSAPSHRRPPSAPANDGKPPELQARLNRESSERERALELIRRKKRAMEGNATPSTVCDDGDGYRDVFNRREVEDAHRTRDRRWDNVRRRGWDEDEPPSSHRRR